MVYKEIVYETKGAVALITLNRPNKLNAWTPNMCEEQADAISKANEDSSIGSIVMTGAGRGFCAGADVGDTFQTRLGGEDPGNDTVGGSGGMPPHRRGRGQDGVLGYLYRAGVVGRGL